MFSLDNMGESFQDYSRFLNFEADFPQKVSLKILNLADYNSLSGFLIVYLNKNDGKDQETIHT